MKFNHVTKTSQYSPRQKQKVHMVRITTEDVAAWSAQEKNTLEKYYDELNDVLSPGWAWKTTRIIHPQPAKVHYNKGAMKDADHAA